MTKIQSKRSEPERVSDEPETPESASPPSGPPSDPPSDPPGSSPSGPSGEYQRIDIVDEMKTSYLDYSMSVIVARARCPMFAMD